MVSKDAYYPFGMRIAGLSQTVDDPDPRYKYNGKELDEEKGLNWLAYGARYYDPEIGRWHVVDPVDQFWSGYLGIGNNPILYVDPDGRDIEYWNNGEVVYIDPNETVWIKYAWGEDGWTEFDHPINQVAPEILYGELLLPQDLSIIHMPPGWDKEWDNISRDWINASMGNFNRSSSQDKTVTGVVGLSVVVGQAQYFINETSESETIYPGSVVIFKSQKDNTRRIWMVQWKIRNKKDEFIWWPVSRHDLLEKQYWKHYSPIIDYFQTLPPGM
jgi:RHS repeat-associated protein